MNWLESLLWDPSSVAHIVCLYAFVISVGVLLVLFVKTIHIKSILKTQ